MKFMLLIYRDEAAAADVSREDLVAEGDAYEAFTKSIVESGNFLDGDPFEPTGKATTVSVRDGRLETRPGPVEQTKLQLGAYYRVEAESQDQAIEMAARIPGARRGFIEVRPVWNFEL